MPPAFQDYILGNYVSALKTLLTILYRVARKNATTLIVDFMNIVDETELFCISFGRTLIFQQNNTMIISFG